MTVVEHIEAILRGVEKDSGYPFPEGHQEPDSNRPFAYGLVMGTLMSLKLEWERRLDDPVWRR